MSSGTQKSKTGAKTKSGATTGVTADMHSTRHAWKQAVTLKELAAELGLSQSTVSRVLNQTGTLHRIAAETQKKILHAATLHGYTPNIVARGLRQKRSYTIGVIVPEISEGYSTAVLSGIEDALLQEDYFYFVASHRHHKELLEGYPLMMIARGVEGILMVDSPVEAPLRVPTVVVSGHKKLPGLLNIELDHMEAARLAFQHLRSLGHTKIAILKGQSFSSDTELRWRAIQHVSREVSLTVDPELVVYLDGSDPGPGPGYRATMELLGRGRLFSAIFAFNDISAIGAITALREAGIHVPRDVSVVGFDDVLIASTSSPALTTVRQPLREMGQTAARTLLDILRADSPSRDSRTITVHPQLIVRKSTAHASAKFVAPKL